jgi:hypothetical protein
MVAPLVDAQLYQRMVWKFIFFTQTRPDIAFAVNMVSRFSHQPQVLHLDPIKHLLRYIKGTLDQVGFIIDEGRIVSCLDTQKSTRLLTYMTENSPTQFQIWFKPYYLVK